jgi:hypothetical protein
MCVKLEGICAAIDNNNGRLEALNKYHLVTKKLLISSCYTMSSRIARPVRANCPELSAFYRQLFATFSRRHFQFYSASHLTSWVGASYHRLHDLRRFTVVAAGSIFLFLLPAPLRKSSEALATTRLVGFFPQIKVPLKVEQANLVEIATTSNG